MIPAMRQGVRIARTLVAGAAVLTTCALAACGGSASRSSSANAGDASNGPSAAIETQYRHAVKFASCMRAHGVSQFPDPKNPGGFPEATIKRLNDSAPGYAEAHSQCDPLLQNAGAPTRAESASTLVNAVKVAKCMRAHGVNMPDPSLQPNGQLEFSMANVNINAPNFDKVGDICEKKVYGYS
jgi:hypothetical protein